MRKGRGLTAAAVCQQCGRDYRVKPYELLTTRYCSRACAHQGYKAASPPAERLKASSTPPDVHGCRLWSGATRNGYGALRADGRTVGAHVLAYALANNVPLTTLRGRQVHVSHLCDRFYPPGDIGYRRCVEPNHLKLETPGGNLRHMHELERQPKGVDYGWKHGSAHHQAKLTEPDVLTIRAAYAGGTTMYRLAKQYGLALQSISRIVRRVTWTHV